MTAHDLWVLGIFQGDVGGPALATMYAMDTGFYLLIGGLSEREIPDFYEAARRKVGLA